MRQFTLPKISPRLLTTAEAAELLNVSQRTVLNWIKRGSVPYIELPSTGRRKEYRIPEVALLRSLSGNYDLVADLRSLDDAAAKADLDDDRVAELVVGKKPV